MRKIKSIFPLLILSSLFLSGCAFFDLFKGSKKADDNTSEQSTTNKDEAAQKYTIMFNANGGTGSMDDVKDIYGNYILPDCQFTAPSGFKFDGWSIGNIGETKVSGTTIIVSQNIILYAQWSNISGSTTIYTISFDSNGGTGTMSSITNETGLYALPHCSFVAPIGQKFSGWKVNNENETRYPDEIVQISLDTIIYAVWEDDVNIISTTYNVAFNSNGGSGTMSDAVVNTNTYTLPLCGFAAPNGMEFSGWLISNSGTLLQPNETIEITADIEVFAQWSEISQIQDKYIVSFNANGGEGEMNDIEVTPGDTINLPACLFTRDDFEFIGWSTSADGDVEYFDQQEDVEVENNMTMYAVWVQ